ncbi:MAG: hypothetical protein ABSD13_03020 [Candidatus Korobacteraceae bacterium]
MPKASSHPPVTHERPSSFVSLLSGWAQQGIESFFATQRILVDLAMRENTSAIKSIRQGLSASEGKDSPMKILTEIAVEGSANYVEAQRILLDLAQQENDIVMNGVKERVGGYGTAVALTNVIRRSIDAFVEMQQNFLVLANKRTQSWLQSAPDVSGLAGLANEAMEEFVAAQKRFLDVISEEASGEAKKEHAGKKTSKTELAQLGRDAADAFIDAQKKLLDLAGQQANVNMQAASRAMELKMPIRLLPVADIAGESVKSFVDAEKALLNSMMKTRNQVKKSVKAKRTIKRPAHRTRSAAQAKAAHAAAVEV